MFGVHSSTPTKISLACNPLPGAETLALSVTSSGWAEFTPRASLRPGCQSTPLAPPSVSRGASFSPPSGLKEARLSFTGGGRATRQMAGAADDRKAKRLVTTTPSRHRAVLAQVKWPQNKDKATSFDLKHPEMDPPAMPQETPSQSLEILDSSKRNSNLHPVQTRLPRSIRMLSRRKTWKLFSGPPCQQALPRNE